MAIEHKTAVWPGGHFPAHADNDAPRICSLRTSEAGGSKTYAGKSKENGPLRHLNEPTLSQIFLVVCVLFGISKRLLLSHRRCMFLVRPRMLFYAVARDMTSKSFPQIGAACNRHHSTVLHGCIRVDENISDYAADIARIKEIVARINKDTPE
jgi:hypothetical protein